MPEFIVPKFITREMKVVGPLTLKQFIFIAAAGGIIFFLRYFLPFPIFLLSAILIGGGGFALAFVKIRGLPLPIVIANFFKFSVSPKLYIWKTKRVPVVFFKGEIRKASGESPLEIGGGSQLKKIKTDIELKTK